MHILKTKLRWITVEIDGTGNAFIASPVKYLIFAGTDDVNPIQLNAVNVLNVVPAEDIYLDTLSAESDYFTRLLCASSMLIDSSNLRSGRTAVKALFKRVQILEYSDHD
jgi:hypothetical protein